MAAVVAAAALPLEPKGLLTSWLTTEALDVVGNLNKFNKKPASEVEFDGVTCTLAACYGELTSEGCKTMDKELLLMLAVGLKKLNELPKHPPPEWNDIIAAMKNCDALEEVQEEHVHIDDSHMFSDATSWFKVDGSADPVVVEAFKTWFKSHIRDVRGQQDDDVLNRTKFNDALLAELGGIVAETGVHVDSFAGFWADSDYKERSVLDIGIIRFPDISHPYLKVYRILVKVWRSCKKIVMVQTDQNGAKIVFDCTRYTPRPEVMAKISAGTFDKAAKEIDDMF